MTLTEPWPWSARATCGRNAAGGMMRRTKTGYLAQDQACRRHLGAATATQARQQAAQVRDGRARHEQLIVRFASHVPRALHGQKR
jgi:hypothetical protein